MTQHQDDIVELPALRKQTFCDLWKLDMYSCGNSKVIIQNSGKNTIWFVIINYFIQEWQ